MGQSQPPTPPVTSHLALVSAQAPQYIGRHPVSNPVTVSGRRPFPGRHGASCRNIDTARITSTGSAPNPHVTTTPAITIIGRKHSSAIMFPRGLISYGSRLSFRWLLPNCSPVAVYTT